MPWLGLPAQEIDMTTLPDLTQPLPTTDATAALPNGRPKTERARRVITASAFTSMSTRSAGTGPLLNVPGMLEELDVSPGTWAKWRQAGKTPRMLRLPNRELRCYRSVFDAWLETLLEEEAA